MWMFWGVLLFFSEPCRAPPETAIVRNLKNIVEFQEEGGAYLRDIMARDPADMS